MKDWFTVEQIDENTFSISEYRHWEESHNYLLIGKTSSLLIDTGLGIENINEQVVKLTDKPIIAVATHIHWDQIDLLRKVNRQKKKRKFIYEGKENIQTKRRAWKIFESPSPMKSLKRTHFAFSWVN